MDEENMHGVQGAKRIRWTVSACFKNSDSAYANSISYLTLPNLSGHGLKVRE